MYYDHQMKLSYGVGAFIFSAMIAMVYFYTTALQVKRNFIVLHNEEFGFCFLVDDGYKFQISDNSFKYSGGKNQGHMQLISGSFSKGIHKTKINGFSSGYKKEINKRIYEYKLNDKTILRDTFVNRQQMPVNLVPYREDCQKIKMNFINHIQIFNGE
jgi:hypothetical protein